MKISREKSKTQSIIKVINQSITRKIIKKNIVYVFLYSCMHYQIIKHKSSVTVHFLYTYIILKLLQVVCQSDVLWDSPGATPGDEQETSQSTHHC